MKYVLIYLLGATTAASWFAAALWGSYKTETTNMSLLWAVPILLTLGAIAAAIAVAFDEAQP